MLDRRVQRSGDGLHPPDSAFMEDGLDVVAAPRRPVQRTLADETSRTFAFRCFFLHLRCVAALPLQLRW